MGSFRTGAIVAALLALLTVMEYVIASEIHDENARFVVLAVGTVFECWLIAWYYMHLPRLWRRDGGH